MQSAIRRGVADYFDGCRRRVDGFISRHFRYPGAWQTNRPALGWDLLRAPVNLFWAPLYVIVMLLSWLTRKLGWNRLNALLRRVPAGCNTRVQAHIAGLIYSDLLRQGGEDDEDQLRAAIINALDELVDPGVRNRDLVRDLEPVVTDALSQYKLARTASADITNSLVSAALGAFAFKKFTPGGIAVGLLLASWLAQRQAVEHFWLGDFLGGLYYGLFPAEPSLGLQVGGVAVVLTLLAVFASFSGLVTDPIQAWTGLHRYRLNKMLNSMQRDFESGSENSFNPKDPYLARVLEILDAAKSHLA